MHNSNDIPLLERQHSTAQYLLLATVLTTVANIVLLLAKASFLIPYCAALPYYLTMLGYLFDGYTLASYTAIGMAMAFVLLAGWLLVWWLAKRRTGWLKVGLVLVILDTVALAIIAFLFLENPASCLLEGLLHLAVIYEIHVGLKAHKQLAQIQSQSAEQNCEPWDDETPAESEYSSDINQ